MKQYHDLLRRILTEGTQKPAAREGMPGSLSLFGPQIELDLNDGFPILTTKKVKFEHIATELMWFLKGDTNIKYLMDRNCNIWNDDAYNYYKNLTNSEITKEQFIDLVKNTPDDKSEDLLSNYKLGDCGNQYGKTWRDFAGSRDQINELIMGLITKPEGRRHLISSIDPANDKDLALYWCHALFQVNARPIEFEERCRLSKEIVPGLFPVSDEDLTNWLTITNRDYVVKLMDDNDIPKFYLDGKMFQRSADVFLGVPYNISSYALFTLFLAMASNMLPGKYIHTFGDVHIYDNHKKAVDEILTRDTEKYSLPELTITPELANLIQRFRGTIRVNGSPDIGYYHNVPALLKAIDPEMFKLLGYESYPRIKAELSTGTGK